MPLTLSVYVSVYWGTVVMDPVSVALALAGEASAEEIVAVLDTAPDALVLAVTGTESAGRNVPAVMGRAPV